MQTVVSHLANGTLPPGNKLTNKGGKVLKIASSFLNASSFQLMSVKAFNGTCLKSSVNYYKIFTGYFVMASSF